MQWVALYVVYALTLSTLLWRRGFRSSNQPSNSPGGKRPGRVLIVGATGGTGQHLVAQALERGYEVTALVRDPGKLATEHDRLTIVTGNVLEPASVDGAMRQQDAVLSALGHKRFFYPTRILSEGTANILEAMEAHGARRLVCETALGIGSSAGRLGLYYSLFVIPIVLPFYFWDKTRQEKAIADRDVEWVLVRPGALTNGKRRGKVRHGSRVGSFLWTVRIPRADVAAFMLDQLESDTYLHQAPGVV